jgi:hypothetical protein
MFPLYSDFHMLYSAFCESQWLYNLRCTLSSTFEHWNHGTASHVAWIDVCTCTSMSVLSSVGKCCNRLILHPRIPTKYLGTRFQNTETRFWTKLVHHATKEEDINFPVHGYGMNSCENIWIPVSIISSWSQSCYIYTYRVIQDLSYPAYAPEELLANLSEPWLIKMM